MLWMPHFAGCLLRVCWEGHYDNGLDNGQVRMSMKLKMLTEYPSWIQEPTIKLQFWSSNGKKATLTGQVERNLVGGGQKTRPLLWTKAKLLMYWPLKSSALQLITMFWKSDFFHTIILKKVRSPAFSTILNFPGLFASSDFLAYSVKKSKYFDVCQKRKTGFVIL